MKSFISTEPHERPDRADPWHGVERADQLAKAIHDAALGKYPETLRRALLGHGHVVLRILAQERRKSLRYDAVQP